MLRVIIMTGVLLIGLIATVKLKADLASDKLIEANTAYDAGELDKAKQIYRELIKDHPANGKLYYNLANIADRKGEVGEAMAALLKGRSLRPRDPDLKANLSYLAGKIADKLSVERQKSIIRFIGFWTNWTTLKEMVYLSAFFLMVLFIMISVWLFKPKLTGAKQASIVLACLCALSLFATSISFNGQETWGAVTADQTDVFSGPSTSHKSLFQLREGAPFMVNGSLDNGWYKIELSDGKKGWVAATKAQVF